MKTLLLLSMLIVAGFAPAMAAARQTRTDEGLPPVTIDALEGYRWSNRRVVAAPGQRMIITNRDVERHNFTVDEWGIDEPLPALSPIEVYVPEDQEIGTRVSFYSSVGNDRELGLEGIIEVVSPDQVITDSDPELRPAGTIQNRAVIEANDDFTYTPSEVDIQPGAFIEVRNTGVIEHHFVVDAWDVNETIPAGDVAIVQVPSDVGAGDEFIFYCSVPGHEAQGMNGVITIVPERASVGTVPTDDSERVEVGRDLRAFLPEATFLGPEWSQLRSGEAGTLLESDDALVPEIFPQEGIGAVYVGPQGSRVTLIVLPVTDQPLPANQVQEAMGEVQAGMTSTWSKDRIASAAFFDEPPPPGCDAAHRASGIVPVLTIPAGATACQLRSADVAIFVTVEGSVGDLSGVEAADQVIGLLLTPVVPEDAGSTSADG